MTTHRQRDLTDRLMPYVGMTAQIRDTATELERLARSYQRIQERWCCEEMTDETTAKLEARETRLEERITALADSLPAPSEPDDDTMPPAYIGWLVEFEGDPRGPVVALHPHIRGDSLRDAIDRAHRTGAGSARRIVVG